MGHQTDSDSLPGSHGEHVLQSLFDTRERAQGFYQRQVAEQLTPLMKDFIARQEMAFVGTADASGNCDTSFRAGPKGFVRVLSETMLAYPEFRGNGVLASMGNILENPHVSLLFVDFFDDLAGLHVNGKASITTALDASRRHGLTDDDRTAPGRRVERWVLVEVEEAYIHCSKHIPRMVRKDRRDGARPATGDHFGVEEMRSREHASDEGRQTLTP
ncbi:pyridoxamine 5'-phosphate oxidase family protein [Streptosporangium soli]|nr:pyridoxamine 5'-phosphate oxidase family protein [Streptosporangium sp. KLBMP 9127]